MTTPIEPRDRKHIPTASGIRRWLDADRALALTLGSRIVPLAAAPITLLLVAMTTSPAEQGTYFVFATVLAIPPLFETGVATLIVQFAGHLDTVGDRESLANAARRLFGRTAAILVAGLLLLGTLLVRRRDGWHAGSIAAWCLLALCVAVWVAMVPLVAVHEGSGRLESVQRLRFHQAIGAAIVLWCVIPTLGGAWAVALSAAAQVSLMFVWLATTDRLLTFDYLKGALPRPGPDIATYSRAQFRTAIQWSSGFVATQLLTPLVYVLDSPSSAGRVGISFAVMTAPLTLAVAWLHSRFPAYARHAALGERSKLERLALGATARAVGVAVLTAAVLLVALAFLRDLWPLVAARFLGLVPLASLGAAAVALVIVQAINGYLRAERDEPLAHVGVGVAACSLLASAAGARMAGGAGAVLGYSGVYVFLAVPWSLITARRLRNAATSR